MTAVEYARKMCKEKGIAISKMEKDLNFGNGYLNPKKAKKIPFEKAVAIAMYLGCDVSPMLDNETISYSAEESFDIEDFSKKLAESAATKIPVVRRVAAGIPLDCIEEVIDWEELPTHIAKTGSYFGLRVSGNSMEPGICDGDVVIVREQPDAEDGQIVVALVNGNDGVCKRLKKYDDGIALVSDNPAYQPMYFSNKEKHSRPVVIKGIVKELRRKF